MDISSDQMKKFMVGKKLKAACPRCGETHWSIHSGPSPKAGLWLAKDDGNFSIDGKVASVVLTFCTNCGFISSHAENVVRDWLKAQGELDGE